ncbi:MAG: family 10 glycosylhydrolase, partial [Kiritimatiellaeota bacterium]|nr:family 10 glycosylhydrolase [Kiritimatiellota bacterium]
AFFRFREGDVCLSQNAEYIREDFFKHADLTGEDLIIGKVNGPLAQKCYVAYVKLVPLTSAQVEAIKADRARKDTRSLVATIDGMSYFWSNEYRTREQLLELVERYRYSDVGKVLLAVNSGDIVWYPGSKLGRMFSGEDSRTRLVDAAQSMPSPYVRSEKVMRDSLRDLASRKVDVQNTIAEHAHSMGLKFDVMFRLGMSGHLPPCMSDKSFVVLHPEFRQVMKDGTAVEKASYAFPEVREFMLGLIREATERFDADGINLCFTRGPHFLLYEQPVVEAFRAKYGEDARAVDPADPRLSAVKAGFMTDFVSQARRVLDEVGKKKGRRLELSVWVWPSNKNVWLGKTPVEEGLDVKAWIQNGLLDSVICQEGIDQEYIRLGNEKNCKVIYFSGYRGEQAMSPKNVLAGHEAGAGGFAYWDMDCIQDLPATWEWLSRTGHVDEMKQFKDRKPALIQLRTIGGYDCMQGLEAAVYSGG